MTTEYKRKIEKGSLTTHVNSRLPNFMLKQIDKLVSDLAYNDRSHFIKKACWELLKKEKEIGRVK